jgi:type IV secretion system protein VirB9
MSGPMRWAVLRAAGALLVFALPPGVAVRSAAAGDARIRTVVYAVDEVYRLRGYVGFQIDLEFEAGESFVGLGAGDVEGLAFAPEGNHLFLKPRAAAIETNLTVLTNRRTYHFEYLAGVGRADTAAGDVVYVLRFVYGAVAAPATQVLEEHLAQAVPERSRNLDYGYCGSRALQPESAWDDGVQTHLRFGARQELPAIFVHNEDGSESLVNFTVAADELIVHRVVRRLIVRRGHLTGCIVNQRFAGAGAALESGTLAPDVQRVPRGDAR